MYGVGQTSQRRRGSIVIFGVMIIVLMLVALFYAFYALVLKEDTASPSPTLTSEATATIQVVSATDEVAPTPVDTMTSVPKTPTVKPTLRATGTAEPTATLRPPPEVITVGVRARINISEGFAINLRDLPALSGSTVITELVAGAEVDVVAGPEDVGDLRWWNVNGGEARAGWVVEAFGGETWLMPVGWTDQLPPLFTPAPTASPATVAPTPAPVVTPTATLTLEPTATPEVTATVTPVLTPTSTTEGGIPSPTVGGRAQVTTQYQFVNLRAAPGLDSETIGQLADGTVVTIVEGPEEADNIRWWKVDDDEENVGWVAERVSVEVFLVPLP